MRRKVNSDTVMTTLTPLTVRVTTGRYPLLRGVMGPLSVPWLTGMVALIHY